MPSASDIPHRFDVLVNGEGYVFADSEDQNAVLGYSPPFVSRTAIQGSAYGDSETEFFQTFTQKNWSKGETQRYQGRDEESVAQYWTGSNLDAFTQGKLGVSRATVSLSFAAVPFAVASSEERDVAGISHVYYAAGPSAGNLYKINLFGTITSMGAHGAGDPFRYGITTDSTYVYLAGTSKIRKWDGTTFTDFSATVTGTDFGIVSQNNALYGLGISELVRWDTAGAATTLYTWKGPTGAGLVSSLGRVLPFGGKLAIMRQLADTGAQLWIYDGTAPAMVHQFPDSFYGHSMTVQGGVIFVSGGYLRQLSTTPSWAFTPAVMYYANGTIGELWRAQSETSTVAAIKDVPMTAIANYRHGVVFTDDTAGRIMFYNPAEGGVTAIASYTVAGDDVVLAGGPSGFIHTRNQTTGYLYPATTYPSSAFVTTSLVDFDSSLNKRFRSIEVEFDSATDGDGGTVDIAYRVADVDGSYTSLVTGATSGSENPLTNITGKSISVKVTLNKSTSTAGPVLKRIKVRAVPVRPAFRKDKFVLNLQGRDGNNLRLRDQTVHVKDGKTMATDLRTAATQTNPFTIIDTFGSYTGVIETLELVEVRPEEFLAIVTAREV